MASFEQTKTNFWRARIKLCGVRDSATFKTKEQAICWAEEREGQIRSLSGPERREWKGRMLGYGKMLSYEELREMSQPALTEPGIYFLFIGAELVYIGESTNPLERVRGHARAGRSFDRYTVIPASSHPAVRRRLEARYIGALKPTGNRDRTIKRHGVTSPLRQSLQAIVS